MSTEEIRELIKIFEEADITEMDVEKEGLRLRLKKDRPEQPAAATPSGSELRSTPGASSGPPASEEASEPVARSTIHSPMVGVFYSAPSPDAESFVEVGDVVEVDQTVCIIEAMKLMNEIKADKSGRVKEVLVENGHSVEYGQPLFVLSPLSAVT